MLAYLHTVHHIIVGLQRTQQQPSLRAVDVHTPIVAAAGNELVTPAHKDSFLQAVRRS